MSNLRISKQFSHCHSFASLRTGSEAQKDRPLKISIIIPALNEEAIIGQTLQRLAYQKPDEIIVADGGSKDGTIKIAKDFAAVISAPRGRARQMNAGARIATGDILVFLHVDTELPSNALEKILSIIRQGQAKAGKFRLRFRPETLRLKLYASYTRFQFFSYGDQAFFVRKDLFDTMGGFREDVPFEDIDFYTRLRKKTKPVILPDLVITSTRRFQKVGIAKQKWINFWLVLLYYLGVDIRHLKECWYADVREKVDA